MKKSIRLLEEYRRFGANHCHYTVNSQGYRCPEFDTIDWENSVLLFGCSHVFGIGLLDEETLANQLSLILNCPVINLGMGGSGYTYQWINSTILGSHGIQPKAAIYLWPEVSRQTIFDTNDIYHTQSRGFWSVTNPPDYKQLGIAHILDPYHSRIMGKYQRDNLKLIWDCPILYYCIGPHFQGPHLRDHYTDELETDIIPLKGCGDYARDNAHFGPASNQYWASIISTDLQKKFI